METQKIIDKAKANGNYFEFGDMFYIFDGINTYHGKVEKQNKQYRKKGEFDSIIKFVGMVNERTRNMIKERNAGKSYKAIGYDNGISKQRVHQIIMTGIEKILNTVKKGNI